MSKMYRQFPVLSDFFRGRGGGGGGCIIRQEIHKIINVNNNINIRKNLAIQILLCCIIIPNGLKNLCSEN